MSGSAIGSVKVPASDGATSVDIAECDREPIHIPGSIQPHGLLLIASAETLRTIAGAGAIEERLTPDWLDRPLSDLLGVSIEPALEQARAVSGTVAAVGTVRGASESFDATLHISGDHVLVELEPRLAPVSAAVLLARLDAFGAMFERASDLTTLAERAASAFRELTGFDRVMIYRFLDDGAGVVIAEDRDPALHSFLNHHFPASDIPQQARALYVRNRVRVIADTAYTPQPIRPANANLSGIDLSDSQLRSVSPIHLQYLHNMGVAASASISIVKDGLLWGLVACHGSTPRPIGYEARIAAQALAGGLARQVRAKEEAEAYRDRIRLRTAEEQLIARLERGSNAFSWIGGDPEAFLAFLPADGFAALRANDIALAGRCPEPSEIKALCQWLHSKRLVAPFATPALGTVFPRAQAYADVASGLLTTSLPGDEITLMWFRAEEPQVVEWAGNPHKAKVEDAGILRPRSSFEAWREELRGRARRWVLSEVEAVGRLRRSLTELRQARRLVEVNRELGVTLAEKERLIAEKDHLLGEVNHRVQNSLQLVQAFLALQAKAADDPSLSTHLSEAQRRLSAVALVHRRLYQANQVETVDLSRYLDELIGDTVSALGSEWQSKIRLDMAPVLISADRAIYVGLILTELVINANKYAYGGEPGPLSIALEEHRANFRLIVADSGSGKVRSRIGFGTRMMDAMVQRLGGTIEQVDNQPGLRVIVSAPVSAD